jgi:MFS family permease
VAFGAASLAAGFARDGTLLLAARAVQGLGAAAIFPASLAMITTVFPKERRGKAVGTVASIGTAFLMAGPLVGGAFTELISWRWIFWINVPMAAVIAAIVWAAWAEPPRAGGRPKMDWGGFATLAAGLAMGVFAIMQGADWGWTHPTILALLGCGLASLVLFVVIERRVIERGREAPLMDVDLFRGASFGACTLIIFAVQFSKIAVVVFVALYLQERLHMSPLTAGLGLLVAVAGLPLTAASAGRLADKLGARRPALGGLALTALGILWIGLATGWDSYAALVPGLVMWGIASPFCFIPPARAIMNAVPAEKQGQAGGITMTMRLLGASAGIAVCSTLLTSTGRYQVVFLATAGIMLAVLVFGWFAIERSGER